MLNYNKTAMYSLYIEYTKAKTKQDKSLVIGKIKGILGEDVARSTIFNILKKFKNPTPPKPKPSLSDLSIQRDLDRLAKMKQGMSVGRKGSPLSTEKALLALEKAGLLENKLSRSQWDRLLKAAHLSNRHFSLNKSLVTKLKADHANHFLVVDATPIPQYFLNLKDNSMKYRSDILMFDKHLEDALAKYNLRKVWLYVMRDLFSGAYLVMLDIPTENGGETALAHLKILQYWIHPKRDKRVPIVGVPRFIMSDKGSGLTSEMYQSFIRPLGIEHRIHLPGNPAAKGFVEGQIRAIQQNIFKFIRKRDVRDFDEFMAFVEEHVIYDNHIKGYYKNYYNSLLQVPPRIVKTNMSEVIAKTSIRKLNTRGAVRINGKPYILIGANDNDLVSGEEIKICKRLDGTLYAMDSYGNTYELRQGVVERSAETFKILNGMEGLAKKSSKQIQREAIQKESKEFVEGFEREVFLPPDTLYPEYNISEDAEQPALPHEEHKALEYQRYVLELAGLEEDNLSTEIRQKIHESFIHAIQNKVEVSPEILRQLANSLLEGL
jgi:hypothetical protein